MPPPRFKDWKPGQYRVKLAMCSPKFPESLEKVKKTIDSIYAAFSGD
jgi:hypothetical protein